MNCCNNITVCCRFKQSQKMIMQIYSMFQKLHLTVVQGMRQLRVMENGINFESTCLNIIVLFKWKKKQMKRLEFHFSHTINCQYLSNFQLLSNRCIYTWNVLTLWFSFDSKACSFTILWNIIIHCFLIFFISNKGLLIQISLYIKFVFIN